ncbi:MAG: phosphoglycerate mutase [Betaproteobacteria bacterium]|nr:phosphoglycerate mutase [Betaproteobacteria bacterium]
MHLHLLIPDLFWPDPRNADVYRDLGLPGLERLLSRGTRSEMPGEEAEAWLCRAFGVPRQQDWPVAPLTLEGDGGRAGDAYWLRADPVHLRIERDQAVLADSGTFSISQAEANALTEALNTHLQGDGLIFYPLRPDRWYLRVEHAPRFQTHPLPAAAGRNIPALLPAGEEGPAWRRLLNEIQMLFHQHAVNEAREARGDMPVNSVWLWGGGVAPQSIDKPYDAVFADDPLALALAARSGASPAPLPGEVEQCFAAPGPGTALAMLDALRGAAQYGDAYGWREGLQKLEATWFAPLLDALGSGRPGTVTVHATGPAVSRRFTVSRTDLRKFWRGRKPLASIAGISP